MINYVLKGNICYSRNKNELNVLEHGYLVCEDGKSAGVYETLPGQYQDYEVKDYGDRIIIPGMTDLHVHAPQYTFRGLNMDLELLEWLNTNTFPEEAKYQNLEYADQAYEIFVDDLKKSATTRACIFGTIHVNGTLCLMDKLEKSGLYTMVGKINMDRNAPEYLVEENARKSVEDTIRWIAESKKRFSHAQPILTPRFIPSCTDELMQKLGELQKETGLAVQSHLSENQGEIAWVKELCPSSKFYGDAYDQFGLFGGDCRTIMAHCVSSSEEEIKRMKEKGVFIAHCPASNANLSSGVAPVRRYLEEGLNMGLGSDIAGGTSLSIFEAMGDAVKCSKLRWRMSDETLVPLTFEEVFYLGTMGGGAFFGKVGSFEKGYALDAVVLDDSNLRHPQKLTVKERLERMVYLSDDRNVVGKYVEGIQLF